MKRKLVTLVMILVCFLVQTTVWNLLPLGNVKPNLLLILTVSLALMRGRHTGLWVGFISGLIIDLFYGNMLGFNALIYMYLGYFNGRFCNVFFDEDIKIPMVMVAVSGFAYNIIFYIVQFLFRQRYDLSAYMVHIILPEILYTVLCTLILYKLIYHINKKLVANELEERDSPWLRK
jgi:rod shape-determining protein MreD